MKSFFWYLLIFVCATHKCPILGTSVKAEDVAHPVLAHPALLVGAMYSNESWQFLRFLVSGRRRDVAGGTCRTEEERDRGRVPPIQAGQTSSCRASQAAGSSRCWTPTENKQKLASINSCHSLTSRQKKVNPPWCPEKRAPTSAPSRIALTKARRSGPPEPMVRFFLLGWKLSSRLF